MESIIALMIPIVAILVFGSPLYLHKLTSFLVEWRKAGSGSGQEATALRQELSELRSDYRQLKADHNDMLLDLNRTVHLLELRLDRLAGIEAPPPETGPRPPAQRQL